MNGLSKKANVSIKRGTVISGKWHNKKYVIDSVLGVGAIGTVYLCRKQSTGEQVALKISDQPLAMTAEVKVLQSLQKVQDARLGPCLLDVDDWERMDGSRYSFYVMEYIRGIDLRTFIRNHGSKWIGVLMLQMLEQLDHLHRAGYVFGDLKNDNLIVMLQPPTIRLIDVGGTTKMGRSIKEYTNFHDRAYWHLGKRVAEPSYDLFALVMVILAVYYPKTFQRTNDSRQLIKRKMMQVGPLKQFYPCFEKAIDGKYKSAKQMYEDVLQCMTLKKLHHEPRTWKEVMEAILLLIPTTIFYVVYYFM